MRTRPALTLRRNPLVLVLAQARIAPVLQLPDLVPALQERLRTNGYPRFSTVQSQQVLVGPFGMPTPPGVQPSQWAAQYHFGDRDQKRDLIVGPEFVTLEVSSYTTFETFLDEFAMLFTIVGEIVQPSLVERVGLRYLDLVQAQEGETINDLLEEGIRGLDSLPLKDVQQMIELQGTSDVGTFIFRATRPQSGFMPPDLQPLQLEITPPEPLSPNRYVVLDFDHFTIAPRDYVVPDLVNVLWSLHDLIDLGFRKSVVKAALERWQ
jgi:uncharacterized protein (TIGR04255 family)